MVAEFAAERLAPYVAGWNAAGGLPLEAVRQMGELGLFGLGGPEEYGGVGDFTSLCIAIEEIGRVDQSLGITLEAGLGLGANPIARFGTPEQKERWLPDLLAGRTLAAFGLTEAEAGSDASATRTRAELVDGTWVINGGKQFITNSGTADHLGDHRHRRHRTARRRPTGALDDHGPGRHAGPDRRSRVREAGLARLRHPPGDLGGRPGARRSSARCPGAWLRAVPVHVGRRADRHRGAGAGLHPRLS